MKNVFIFAGQAIDLNQPKSDVLQDMQSAIDRYYPTPNVFVRVLNYNETDPKTFDMEIERQYSSGAGLAFGKGFICDQDASLLTGLSIDAFQPFVPGEALIAPLIPWYDNMVYTADDSFSALWKRMNKVMAKEKIKSIQVSPSINKVHIKVRYS